MLFFVPVLLTAALLAPTTVAASTTVPAVPFYSQFADITSPTWKKQGCGVTSLAMIADYYSTSTVSVNKLLQQGIAAGAYLKNVGWTYKGLIDLSKQFNLDGKSYDLKSVTSKAAFAQFTKELAEGPVIASVYYKFDPKSSIPHLVVINKIDGNTLYYNDPAAKEGQKTISKDKFIAAWKKRFIVIRPKQPATEMAYNIVVN